MPITAQGSLSRDPIRTDQGDKRSYPLRRTGRVLGDILGRDRDGVVIIPKEDAVMMAEVALSKKTGEDKTFALTDSDMEAYAKKHLGSTAKRFVAAAAPQFCKSFSDRYSI